MQLEGKRVLLTGAAGGLGETAAKALAERGAKLILSSRDAEQLETVRASLPGQGHVAVAVDLLDDDSVERIVAAAGEVDVLIANAGMPGGGALESVDSDGIADVIHVNLEVPIQLSRALIPQMIERGSGQIVLVASLAGKFALPESTLYSGTKAGLRAFAWALRAELARKGVGVTLVSPGFISRIGMFAKRGRKPPPGAGTSSPEQYASSLISAIEKNRGEAVIAPAQLRVLGQLAVLAPGLIERAFRRVAPSRDSPT